MRTETRIKEATIRLVLQHGYDRVSMRDIAVEAGIARSTIYTKWKTKEDLFVNLLWEESLAYLDVWYELVERDSEGGSFTGIYRNALIAIQQNPLILALQNQSRFVLGSFINDEQFSQLMTERLIWNTRLLRMMQEAGLIRDDVDVQTAAWVATIFRQGLLSTSLDLEGRPETDYETVLNLFVAMFQQFIGETNEQASDVGKAMLKDYIEQFKAQHQMSDTQK